MRVKLSFFFLLLIFGVTIFCFDEFRPTFDVNANEMDFFIALMVATSAATAAAAAIVCMD